MTLPGNRKLICVGSYRLTGRRLGKGNFAKVEEAVHSVLKTKVALKIMNLSEIKEDYVIRNLHREARLMSQLNHPCIASLFETMQNGNMYYLVTEILGGGDLCNFIKSQRGGKLEETPTKIFGRQLVSAIGYMHGRGIVHRDLKMENIMLNDNRTHLKIVDFGLSNNYTGDSPLRTHCGSPEYAAPELFVTGQLYGPQVDLWSLGVILYGMVIGHLPFLTSRDSKVSSQDRRKHLLQQINRGLAPGHRKALSIFSIEFRAMLARLLMPDPAKRIRISELIRHPWITDRNRKPLRATGIDSLDGPVKSLLMKEVGKLLHAESTHVLNALRNEPYGAIGGMYNILNYKRNQRLELTIMESVKIQQPARPATTSITAPAGQYVSRFQTVNRPVTALPCARHAQSTQQAIPKSDLRKYGEWTNDIQGTPSRIQIIGTRTINKAYNLRSSAKPVTPQTTQNGTRDNVRVVIKPPTENIASRKTKSEPIPQPPKTSTSNNSNTTPVKTSDRASKRKSEQLQQQQQQQQQQQLRHNSAGKSAPSSTTPTRTAATRSTYQSQQPPTRQRQIPEVNEHESHVGKRLLNEPIARCIAGYVGKYMNANPAKMDQRLCIVSSSRHDHHRRNELTRIVTNHSGKECKVTC